MSANFNFKKAWWISLTGAALVGVLVSWFAPNVIAWYFEPPVEIGVNCRPAVEWAMRRLQIVQLISVIAGGVAGFLVGLKFSKPKTGI